MSLAAREALNKLISNADVQQFATHAEDWSACSTTAVLAASADKLGELAEQRGWGRVAAGSRARDLSFFKKIYFLT